MQLGIVGTGMIVKEALPVLKALQIQPQAIFGRDRTKAQPLAKEYEIPKVFDDYAAFLQAEIDTVYIALPNSLHFAFARQALEAGKHVILEKPITSTFAQFQALRSLAKQQNKLLIEAVTVHYLPAYRQLRQEIAKLGEIKIVSLNYSQYSSRYDRFKAGDIAPAFDPNQAGGALMDLNVYNLHFAVGLFGKPNGCTYAANIERNIDTSGILTLNYPHFQAVCIGAKDCQAPIMLSVQGDKGSLIVNMPANSMYAYELHLNKTEPQSFQFDNGHRMRFEFERFARMVDENDREYAEKMLEISGIVCEITETARKQAGIKIIE